MLLEILKYLRREKIASNQQLARAFNLDVTALEPMLEVWIKRGVIVDCQEPRKCQQSCFKNCQKQTIVYYKVLN